ncbi:GGDEF domain-containing protein [Roseibium sp. Sym1]|uniref:GGDEF domain-containing protein n=1 Tax=Roseibium sp. Sym1 TaxID=3016006 RepID=UPI0022B46C6D|nr:GGDEF domain-containing protein [Roseibium sp. Sym1]
MGKFKRQPSASSQRQDAQDLLDWLADANDRVQQSTASRDESLHLWPHQDLLSIMVASVPDFLFIKDRDGRYVMANGGLPGRNMTADQLIGKTTWDINVPEVAAKVRAQEEELFRTGEAQLDYESPVTDKNTGAEIWIRLSRIPIRDKSGSIIGLVGIARDVTAQKQAEEEVRFLAHHDPLTRLPNRSLLTDRLEQAISNADRNRGSVATAFIDLDNFKLINDELGHAAGDELLKIVANRMVEALRATDSVLRLGGDEFVVIFSQPPECYNALSTVANNVRRAISAPITLDDHTVTMTSSMGLAVYPADATDAENLLKNADTAMYRAKGSGRDSLQFFNPKTNSNNR